MLANYLPLIQYVFEGSQIIADGDNRAWKARVVEHEVEDLAYDLATATEETWKICWGNFHNLTTWTM